MKPSTRTRLWRQKNKSKVKAYEKARYPKTHSRVKARRKLEKSRGKAALRGKSVHHVDSNPMSNRSSNLKVVKKYHKDRKDGKINKKYR